MAKGARVPRSAFDGSKNPLGLGSAEDVNVWEETRCPICMEIPHNALLLRCSSFEKGCRPFMCNTSRRHSNCLEQFCKSSLSAAALPEIPLGNLTSTCQWPMLLCPLCRGEIYGWTLVEPARQFMDKKARSCSSETCDFSGTYSQLRKHTRTEHPNVRPTQVDSERQRDWIRLEILRDYEDAHIQPDLEEESPSEDSDSDRQPPGPNESDPDIQDIDSDIEDHAHRPSSNINDSNTEDMFSLIRLTWRMFTYMGDSIIEDNNDLNTESTSRPRLRQRRDNDSDIEDVRSRSRSRHRYDPEVDSGSRGHNNLERGRVFLNDSWQVGRFRARRGRHRSTQSERVFQGRLRPRPQPSRR